MIVQIIQVNSFSIETSFAGFNNMNMILHPCATILNAGWIESTEGAFSFTKEGCSPSVCEVMKAVDRERIAVARAAGLATNTATQTLADWYGGVYAQNRHDLYTQIHEGHYHAYIRAPPTLDNRYLLEDLCYLLLPIKGLAKSVGIGTPVIDSLALMAAVMLGREVEQKRDIVAAVKNLDIDLQAHL